MLRLYRAYVNLIELILTYCIAIGVTIVLVPIIGAINLVKSGVDKLINN